MAQSPPIYQEAHYMARLRQEQEKAIKESNARINQLKGYKSDYTALKKRLKTLPNKVSHDVMVPFGKLAFMPGKLVHTNEILVLLGDNWFAEKSAKEACETIERRLSVLDEQISDLEKQKGLLEPRLNFTSELENLAEQKGDMVEIKEEYDPEKEKLWRAEHKRKMQAYNKQRRQEELQARDEYVDKERAQRTKSEKELWARLDELERLEEHEHEMEKIGQIDTFTKSEGDSSSGSSDSEHNSSKTIRWKDQNSHKTIHFTHTKQAKKETDLPEESSINNESNVRTPVILTPSDIYKHFVKAQEPKSILKQKDHNISDSTDQNERKTITRTVQLGGVHAFSGEIHERSVDPSISMSKDKDSDSVKNPAKRVSKFKVQRMAKR